jgi:hypothetical protein
MSKTDQKKGAGELQILFPYAEISCPDGSSVKVKPLTLEDLPKVLDAFTSLAQLVEAEASPTVLAVAGLRELLQIMPFCIDREKQDVPAAIIPHILEVMIKQNLAAETLGKWQALIQSFSTVAGTAPVGQSKKPVTGS